MGIFLINLIGNATIFFPAPAIASVVVGGALYPVPLVAAVSALGASLGDMVGFFLGLSGKHVLFQKQEHAVYVVLREYFKRFGAIVIFVFALVPNPFFDVVGILAGTFTYSWYRFFLLLLAGRLLRDLALASFGAGLR